MRHPLAACVAVLGLLWHGSPAAAADFYAGKDVTLYVGSPAGGPYDAYARLIARHLGRNIPGHPNIVVQNMPGASGRRLMGFMSNLAPKDGTAIAAPQRAVAFDPLLGVDSHFDANAMAWIGSANKETNVCVVWHTSPIRTIEDVKHREMVVGTSGPSSTDAIYPNLMDNLFGMKFKVVTGYKGAPETHLAMERGEVDGRCGISWDTLKSLNADWLRDKKVRLLVQIALVKEPALPDVPWVFDMAKTDEAKQILTFLDGAGRDRDDRWWCRPTRRSERDRPAAARLRRDHAGSDAAGGRSRHEARGQQHQRRTGAGLDPANLRHAAGRGRGGRARQQGTLESARHSGFHVIVRIANMRPG